MTGRRTRGEVKLQMQEPTGTHERLDEIAERTRAAANQLADAAGRYERGEMRLTELNGIRLAIEALVQAWELEADVRRRRPR